MGKRRRPEPGKTVCGTDRRRRPAAIGEELNRLAAIALKAFTASGVGGLTRAELQRGAGLGLDGSVAVVKKLRAEKRLYVAAWRKGQPAYAVGTLPDMPKVPPVPRGKRTGSQASAADETDYAEIASLEVAKAHAKWAANWIPHRDPAAAWIGSPA